MAIELEDVSKRYAGHLVVNRVSLAINKGEFFVLLGPSGSGKSTLLRMIAGLAGLESGRIVLGGRDVTNLVPQQRNIGFVFQHYALFQHMTVAENIEFGLRVRGMGRVERGRRRDELLDLIGLMGYGRRLPRQLSGGQQQRVALARALAAEPEVLLLDEPFGALDAQIRSELRRTLKRIQRELGITALFVTHDQEEAFELADRLGVMAQGRLFEVGTAEELYLRPQSAFVATFLGTANIVEGRWTARGVALGGSELAAGQSEELLGQRAQVLFRPEEAIIAHEAVELGVPLVGGGRVVERQFAGGQERLRVGLEGEPRVRVIAPVRPFGQAATLEVVRSGEQARRQPLEVGAPVAVGVRRSHVLAEPDLGLLIALDGAGGPLALGRELVRDGQARTTLLAYGSGAEHGERLIQAARAELGVGVAHVRSCVLPDALGAALARAEEALAFELALIAGPATIERVEAALGAGGHHLLVAAPGAARIGSALICVGDGEPSKADIVFAGRLLQRSQARASLLSVVFDEDSADLRRRKALLAAGAATLRGHGIEATTELAYGSAPEIIAQRLRQGDHDLLVLGATAEPGGGGLLGALWRVLSGPMRQSILIVRSLAAPTWPAAGNKRLERSEAEAWALRP